MKQERLKRRRFLLSDGSRMTVDYWLLTERRRGLWYGIVLTDSRGRVVRLPAISASRWEAVRLLRRLARGYVTTIAARDVVNDYLWERRQGRPEPWKEDGGV